MYHARLFRSLIMLTAEMKTRLKKLHATDYSKAYNFETPDFKQLSSIHYFKGSVKDENGCLNEVAYFMPSMHIESEPLSGFVEINRKNQVDTDNVRELPFNKIINVQCIVEIPFPGHVIGCVIIFEDGSTQIQYKPTGYTFAQWKIDNPDLAKKVRLMNEDGEQLDALFSEYELNLISDPRSITAGRYDEMLNVLPPCKWENYGGYSCFHISERLRGNIVSWFAKIGDSYFEFEDLASISNANLIKKLSTIKGA